jgi:hypothetical protein
MDGKQGYQGKGQGAVLAKKGQFASYKEKHRISLLGSVKCFPISFRLSKLWSWYHKLGETVFIPCLAH